MKHLALILSLSIVSSSALADCASNLTELRALVGDNAFRSRWQETTASDGQPLQLTLTQTLHMTFTKGGQTWASGAATICESGNNYVARLPSITWGPAAHPMIRGRRSANFTIAIPRQNVIRVSTGGWSGNFAAR
jgi:hypothetical protein